MTFRFPFGEPSIVEEFAPSQPVIAQEALPELPKVLRLAVFGFNPKTSSIDPDEVRHVLGLGKLLSRHPSAWSKISIVGHSDGVGDPRTNLSLSLGRARLVLESLKKQGFSTDRSIGVAGEAGRRFPGSRHRKCITRGVAARIEDYALIGNFRTAALVSRDGSIDWLCLPRFDSPACFASLVGTSENGYWKLSPRSPFRSRRFYRKDTLILETIFETDEGSAVLIDCMPPGLETPTVLRIVRGLKGTVRMGMELVIRCDYGSVIPWVTRNPFGGIRAVAGPDTLRLKTNVKLVGRDFKTFADFEVRANQSVPFVLTWTESHQHVPSEIDTPDETISAATVWWRDWMDLCTYRGPYEEAVHRSLITLKALTYEPTGGIVAAPTTSLPEAIGGSRNWDYRFCWLRDSTFTLYSLLSAGYRDEALRWRDWLLRAVAGTPSDINIMYGIAGERRLTEIILPWLEGYQRSNPVRIGNAAYGQHQLDIFGELMDTFHLGRQSSLEHDGVAWNIQKHILRFIETAWHLPDHGIWEFRGPRRHFTASKVMAWVALDRGIRAVEEFGASGDIEHWRELASRIRAEVLEKGIDSRRGCFVQSFGARNLDASLLMIPLVGFLAPDDPRVRGTLAAIEEDLIENGFVKRYATEETEDGIPGTEGTFLACTLWLADNFVLQGRLDEARELFERVLSIRNDVGLLSEEYDPIQNRFLGNFPQAFSHVGLINTAVNLSRVRCPANQRSHRSSAADLSPKNAA